MQATFITTEDVSAWRDAHRVVLGAPPGPVARAVASVGIIQADEARWRIDLFESVGHSCFQDVRSIGDLVYIGYGQQVAVFAPKTGNVASHSLDGYFGHLFTASDIESSDLGSSVLVASASELLRFDAAGELLWRHTGLGIDGVVVRRVQDGEIFGDAEWDPPGGWEPFRLNLLSGVEIQG
jgi:hypothetical protein